MNRPQLVRVEYTPEFKRSLLKTSALIILVTIYSKLDQADISAAQVRHILKEFDNLSLSR